MKFKDLARMYIDDYMKANKRSWKCGWYRMEANIKPYFVEFAIQDIPPLEIERYRTARLSKGLSRSSINPEIIIMKRMFNLGIDWKLVDENPFAKVKLCSENDAQRERVLQDDEEVRLFEHLPEYLKLIVWLALHTGMRRGEIFHLQWTHVDL